MFDYGMLNDHEFEILCKDIFKRYLGFDERLYTFPIGRDGGVDICDKEKKIVIQVKHYSKSSVSSLISTLRAEVEKLNNMNNLEKYYIMTSLSLTLSKKNEILEIFQEYMEDISHIWCKEDLDDFLKLKENNDIVAQNFKLWLNASSVLSMMLEKDVLIDSEELLDSIESKKNLYVTTNAFSESLSILDKHNILFLLGAPGVGKSTISEMILLFYVERGYQIRYVSSNSISKLKNSMRVKDVKEIILLDDFLGQHYLKLNETQPNEIKSLLSVIKRDKNKKIVLNTRITILNEATSRFQKFQDTMEEFESKKYTINLDNTTSVEKAKIFYNHLYFNNVPLNYRRNISLDKKYLKIVEHKNYNPRIIEFVTKKRNYNKVKNDDYFDFVLKKLDNSEEIWNDEFENRMESLDRIFMNTLYSLGDVKVNKEVVRSAFNHRIKNEEAIDSTVNNFEKVLRRLTESLLNQSISETKGEVYLSVINPSVNDYLQKSLKDNEIEQNNILNSALYFEQIRNMKRFDTNNSFIKENILKSNFLEQSTLSNCIEYYLLEEVVNNNILDKRLQATVQLCFSKKYNPIDIPNKNEYSSVVYVLLEEEFYEFYELENVIKDKSVVEYIINNLNFTAKCKLFEKLNENNILEDSAVSSFYKSIKATIIDNIWFESGQIISEIIEDVTMFSIDDEHEIVLNVEDELEPVLLKKVNFYYSKIPNKLIDIAQKNNETESEIVLELVELMQQEVRSEVDSFLENLEEPELEYDDSTWDILDEPTEIISEMFDRYL